MPAAADQQVVTPSLRARLGLARAELPPGARKALFMARASAALFAGEGVLAVGAYLAGGEFSADGWVVLGVAVLALGIGGAILMLYERITAAWTQAIAALSAVLIGVLVGVGRPGYAVLYLWLVCFVAFYFSRRAARAHMAWIVACLTAALFWPEPRQRPFELLVLFAGTLGGAAGLVVVVRGQFEAVIRSRGRALAREREAAARLEEALAREREERQLLDVLFADSPLGIVVFDRDLRYARVNETYARWLDRTPQELEGKRLVDVAPEIAAQVEPPMREMLRTGEPVVGLEATGLGGRTFRSSCYALRNEPGEVVAIATIIDDVTELKRVQAELQRALASEREESALLDALFDHAPLGLWFVDRDLRYRLVNREAAESRGLSPEEILGRTPAEIYPELGSRIEASMRRVLETGEPIVNEELTAEMPPGSGTTRHYLLSRYPVRTADGEILGVASMRTDITELERLKARLEALLARERSARERIEIAASTDALTGLANRPAFARRLSAAMAGARRSGRSLALLFLDLDDFKDVNDGFGHPVGDTVLRQVGARLRAAARESDVVARMGGDEFVILLSDLDPALATTVMQGVVERVRQALAAPFAVDGREVHVSASVGGALFPGEASDEQSLLAVADAAMYKAKRRRRSRAA